MKNLLAIFTLAAVALWALPGDGAQTVGNPGGVGSSDINVNGTVTADGFDSPADTDDGGCVVLKECEGGTDCDTAGNGESLSVCLPGNENPLADNKEIIPGWRMDWGMNEGDLGVDAGANLDGSKCITKDSSASVPLTCSTGMSSAMPRVGYLFTDEIWIESCIVFTELNTGTMDDNDLLVLQLQVVDESDKSITDIGGKFAILDDADDCLADWGTTTNCFEMPEQFGEWTVQASSGAVSGYVQLQIDSDTTNPANGLTGRQSVSCAYF